MKYRTGTHILLSVQVQLGTPSEYFESIYPQPWYIGTNAFMFPYIGGTRRRPPTLRHSSMLSTRCTVFPIQDTVLFITHTHARTHTRTHLHTHAHTHAYTHAHTQTHTYTHIHTHTPWLVACFDCCGYVFLTFLPFTFWCCRCLHTFTPRH